MTSFLFFFFRITFLADTFIPNTFLGRMRYATFSNLYFNKFVFYFYKQKQKQIKFHIYMNVFFAFNFISQTTFQIFNIYLLLVRSKKVYIVYKVSIQISNLGLVYIDNWINWKNWGKKICFFREISTLHRRLLKKNKLMFLLKKCIYFPSCLKKKKKWRNLKIKKKIKQKLHSYETYDVKENSSNTVNKNLAALL